MGGGGSKGSQESFSQQQATSTPKLFGPEQIMLPGQRKAIAAQAPSLIEEAMQGGLSPAERSRMMTRMTEDINRSTTGAVKGLEEVYAGTGLKGGVKGADIGDIMEARIGATGAASRSVEDFSRQAETERKNRLLKFGFGQTPFQVAQVGQSSGYSTGKGKQFAINTQWL